MKQINIDWNRIKNALYQKDKSFSLDLIEDCLHQFSRIKDHLGEYSVARPMITSICYHILKNLGIKCIVPVCPDYSHENGVYTLETVSTGVSLIANKHIDFLLKINEIVKIEAHFLFADYEVEDDFLRHKVQLSKEEFLCRIKKSKDNCSNVVEPYGWKSYCMTEFLSNIEEMEKHYSSMIQNEESYRRQIEYDTSKRLLLYDKINNNFTWEEKLQRTVKTASQYYALGVFSKDNHFMICNHTTTNLAWYVKSGASILHNPVVIY